MQTSAPRPTPPAPGPDEDQPQINMQVDMVPVQQPDFTVVQQPERGNDADLGSNERRALATQGLYAATAPSSVGPIGQQYASMAPTMPSRGNATFTTGFDRTPAFTDARSTGLTGPAATYAAFRSSRG